MECHIIFPVALGLDPRTSHLLFNYSTNLAHVIFSYTYTLYKVYIKSNVPLSSNTSRVLQVKVLRMFSPSLLKCAHRMMSPWTLLWSTTPQGVLLLSSYPLIISPSPPLLYSPCPLGTTTLISPSVKSILLNSKYLPILALFHLRQGSPVPSRLWKMIEIVFHCTCALHVLCPVVQCYIL